MWLCHRPGLEEEDGTTWLSSSSMRMTLLEICNATRDDSKTKCFRTDQCCLEHVPKRAEFATEQ